MPTYIDHHTKLPPLPPEALDQMKAKVGQTDAFGVTALQGYFTKDGGGFCVTEAPDADAVCKSHDAMGIPVEGEVREVVGSLN